jgi:hypothetical protein
MEGQRSATRSGCGVRRLSVVAVEFSLLPRPDAREAGAGRPVGVLLNSLTRIGVPAEPRILATKIRCHPPGPFRWTPVRGSVPRMDSRLSIGVAQFNAGRFFVAHEVWEALWLETVTVEKTLLQGLIQIAAGYVKVETGSASGALKLLGRGVERVRQFLPAALGLDLSGLVDGVTRDIARLHAAPADGISLGTVQPPRLELF